MKILQVIPSLSPQLGGPTQAVLGLSQSLQSMGADIEILTTNDDGGNPLDVPLNRSITYQEISTTFLPCTLRAKEFIYSKALTSWHRANLKEFDLVHTHYLFSYLPSWTARAARQQKIPYLMRPLGQLTPWALSQSVQKKKLYAALLERRNLQRAAAIHCTSQEETVDVLQFGIQTPAISVPLGVTAPKKIKNAKERLHQAYDIPEDVPVVLFLSRLHPKKQPEVLIGAISHLFKRQPCHAIFAGTGQPQYLEKLKMLVKTFSLENQVTFTGFVAGNDKQLLLQGADVFALPSHSENFGIAIAEALIAELPVIITPGIQISAEIAAAEAGIVVEADEIAFSEALYQVISQPELHRKLRQNGLNLANTRYSWRAIAQDISLIYQTILSNS